MNNFVAKFFNFRCGYDYDVPNPKIQYLKKLYIIWNISLCN